MCPSPYLVVVVVVSWDGLFASRPQRLQLRIQYVQQLLNQPHGRADVSSLDPTLRVVHQLGGYVGSIFTTLYLDKPQKTQALIIYSEGVKA